MVGVPVADDHGIDGGRLHALKEAWGDAVAGIDQQPEAVGLDDVAGAGLPGRWAGAAAPEHSQVDGPIPARS